jgi:membrane-bound lytic murein transglycosylase B
MKYSEYRKIFIKASKIQDGLDFDSEYGNLIDAVSNSFGVDRYLLMSIVGIESRFGKHAGVVLSV